MAQFPTLEKHFPITVVEKMAIDFMAKFEGGEQNLGYGHQDFLSKWELIHLIKAETLTNSPPYGNVHHIFPNDSGINLYLRQIVEDMIKRNIFIQNQDRRKSLTLSSDYLAKETENFTLDEGIRRYDMTHEEIIAEIIDTTMLAHNSMTTNDGVSIVFLIRSIRLNHGPHSTSGRRRPTVHLLKDIIKNLIDTNVLVYSKEDGKVKISTEYFEKETENFNLDESYEKSDSEKQKHAITKKQIIDFLVDRHHDSGYDLKALVSNTNYILENRYGPGRVTRAFILIVINELLKDDILVKLNNTYEPDGSDWVGIKISPDYLAKETRDFSLDESKLTSGTDEEQQAIKDKILKLLIFVELNDSPIYLNISNVIDIVTWRVYGPHQPRWKYNNKVIKGIHDLVDDGSVVFLPGSEPKLPLIKISPDYLAKETENFTLDEGIDADVDWPSFEKGKFFNVRKGKLVFDIEKMKSTFIKQILFALSNESHENHNVSMYTLGRRNIWAHPDRAYFLSQKGSNVTNRTFVKHAKVAFAAAIKELFDEGIIQSAPESPHLITFSDDYLAQQTKDFSLDERIRMFAQSIILETKTAEITEAKIRALIVEFILADMEEGDNWGHPPWMLVDMVIDDLFGSPDGAPFGAPESTEEADIALKNKILRIINSMRDAGELEDIADPDTSELGVILSDLYFKNQVADFNLDEALDHSLRQQYYVIDDNGEISLNDENLKDAVINSLTTHHEGWFGDKIEFENLNYWTVYDIMGGEEVVGADMPSDEMIEFSRIWDKLYWKIDLTIQDLVEKGVLLYVFDDEVPNLDYVKISPEYLEREVSDFNLDEARHFNLIDGKYHFDEQYFIDLIIEKVKSNMLRGINNVSTIGFITAIWIDSRTLGYLPGDNLFIEFKNFARACIGKLVKQNILEEKTDEDGINVIVLSDEYLSHQTQDFNLDEAVDKRAEEWRFFVIKGDKISFDEEKSRDRILDCVGDRMSSNSPGGINDIIMDVFDEYHDEVQSLSFKSSCFAEDYFAALIKKMVSEGVLEIDDGNPAFGNIVKISDRYIDQQTTDFTLDENIRSLIRSIILAAKAS